MPSVNHHYPSLHLIKHPLIADRLAILRDATTKSPAFRQALGDITTLLAFPLLETLPQTDKIVRTPLADANCQVLRIAPSLIAVLRAGLGMVEPLHALLREASIGHLGMYRDHTTHKPVSYYQSLPVNDGQPYIVCDPMLATGNSAVAAVQQLVDSGINVNQLSLLTLLAAPQGVETFAAAFPSIPVFTAALDSHLNEHAYIVPGLGDAGDRQFGTT